MDDGRPDPMTVAHVIHSLGAGGAEAVLVEMASTAASVGIRPVVVALSEANTGSQMDGSVVLRLRDRGVTVHELQTARYNPVAVLTLAKLLREEQVDIVHTHLKHADVVGGAAARMAKLPSVSTLHVIDTPASWPARLRVRTAVLARRHLSTTVIALSRAQHDWYQRRAGAHAPLVVLPNGVAEPEVTRGRDAVRAEMGVSGTTLLAVCVSLMRPEKGHADLLESIRLLPEDLNVVVAMAGDGPLITTIRATVDADPALRQHTRILGFRSDVADLLSASDFVVHPSREDALPTALISALAAARPVVATDVGGIPDIVGPGCGVLVEAGDATALCAAIAQMAGTVRDGGPNLDAMRRAARRRYEERFSADAWLRGLRATYERAVSEASEPSRTGNERHTAPCPVGVDAAGD